MKTDTKNQSSEQVSGGADTFKWVMVFTLLIAAIIGNHLFSAGGQDLLASMMPAPEVAEGSAAPSYVVPVVFRVLGVIVLAGLAALVAATTTKGKAAVAFGRESRMEMRKVVWPTRQETMQTTLIVLAVTLLMALILWGIDGIMVRLVALATGV